MSWKKILNIIFGILILVLLFLTGYSFYQLKHLDAPEVIEITQRDTILITKADTCWKDSIRYITLHDTVIYFMHDSITDTIMVEIPIEHKEASFKKKQDSLEIEANILYHGYMADIDTVELKYDFHYTQEIKRKPQIGLVYSIGPYVGYGFNFANGQYQHGVEVGLGVSIGFGGIINTKRK